MSEKKGKRKRQPSKPKEGLFDDLESLSDLEIEERTTSLNASMQATEQELKRVEQERGVEITLVQSLRTIQESTRGISKERTSVLNEFRTIRGKAQAIRQKRDAINENVPPPLEIIEQRLVQTHLRLATMIMRSNFSLSSLNCRPCTRERSMEMNCIRNTSSC